MEHQRRWTTGCRQVIKLDLSLRSVYLQIVNDAIVAAHGMIANISRCPQLINTIKE
jgi:hypothetical protein